MSIGSTERDGWSRLTAASLVLLHLAGCRAVPDPGGAVPPSDGRLVVEPGEIVPVDDIFPGGLYQPAAMASSSTGLVCVADKGNHRVVVMDESLELVLEVGREGDGPGEFRQPTGCAVDGSERLFVLDSLQGRLAEFDLQGNLVDTTSLRFPQGNAVVLSNGTVLQASRDFRAVTLHSPRSEESVELELTPPPCGGSTGRFGGVELAGSFDGTRAALVRTSPCDDRDDALLAEVDLREMTSRILPVPVYDESRPRRPPMRKGRGEQHVIVLRPPATDGTRHYVLHTNSRRVEGRALTRLDIFLPGREQPVRAWIGVPREHFDRTRLWLMTATARGDLLVFDGENETLLRIGSADLRALEQR